ncbi:glycosyltransferase family 39 protein [Tautonia sociabilis]|uniref:Glycosyltransferase family 39 protein n=1 Tax=Tautonia sociabilis TaxID=2080755 RepID=A0A432MKW2_9BACT|nr:glycosyltransferase family 39 protein [Tautonia sociabilis]RUL88064.1 glycosyltransferase family 39 protein [Tautonia sociabilis]
MPRIVDRAALGLLLAATFGLRAWLPDQPIVENYVGRQVPTAMVARNLERGSGFLRPQLDTGPFPNLFLVEPPVYASIVAGVSRAAGWPIGRSGRLVSALATSLGAWGLFGLVRRREGESVALLSVVVFATMPVMIRYGRAVQPDAMMIGTQLAALRCWDAFAAGRGRGWLLVGWPMLAASLALKVTSAFVLVPLAVILGQRRTRGIALAASAIGPAVLWYLYAAGALAAGEGSRASLDNGRIWLSVLVPSALLRAETYRSAASYLIGRTFTPIGLVMAGLGWWRRPVDRLWWVWGVSAALTLVALAGKWHHEYYWMVLAPVLSVGIARGLARLAAPGRLGSGGAWAVGAGGLVLAGLCSASTWQTPAEWRSLPEAAEAVRRHVPPGAMLVAPEALLFEADRLGCRLEHPIPAAQRAAGEWGGRLDDPADPLALVEFYRSRGASFLADLGPGPEDDPDPRRAAIREQARRRYRVLDDRPGVFVAKLVPGPEADGAFHAEQEARSVRSLPQGPGRQPGDPADAPALEARGAPGRHADGL